MGTSSAWPVEKNGEASAHQLETLCLGRRWPLLYTAGVVRLRKAFRRVSFANQIIRKLQGAALNSKYAVPSDLLGTSDADEA